MSYIAIQENFDLFGNRPVAAPETLFSKKHRVSASPYNWVSTGTNATVTHTPNSSAVTISIPAANGDNVTWQTKKYIPYPPGKQQEILLTYVPAGFAANRVFEVGQFDDQNGIFLRLTGSTPTAEFVIRTFTSGTAAETDIAAQSSWNVDKFDGSGPSGVTLDFTKAQILVIRYQWLGVGTVEYGFSIDGAIYWAHRFNHANLINNVYMSTATLPIRFRIYNTAASSGTGSILQICTEVRSRGGSVSGKRVEALPFAASNIVLNNTTGRALNNNNRTSLIAIRLKTTLGGVRNAIVIDDISPWVQGLSRIIWAGIYYIPAEDIAAATAVITGGTWTSVKNTSGIEFNTGITAVTLSTLSTLIVEDTIDRSGGALVKLGDFMLGLPFSLNIAGTHSDVLLLQVQRLEANNTTVWGGFTWKETQ